MLNKINLENFKGFKNLKDLNIKPITILTGTNSCGKSSILQSILLLKQTIESKNINQTILLNGRFVHLGIFENLVFEKDFRNSVKLGLCFKIKKEDFAKNFKGNLPIHYILRRLVSEKSYDLPQAEYHFHYNIWLKTNEKDKGKKKTFLKQITVEKIDFNITVKDNTNKSFQEARIEMELKEDEIYEIKWSNVQQHVRIKDDEPSVSSGNDTAKIAFSNLLPISLEPNKAQDKVRDIQYTFYFLGDLFRQVFSTVTYIGPLREEPSRRYIYEDEIVEIGIKGENAAYIFLSEQDKILNNIFILNEVEDNFEQQTKPITLREAVELWTHTLKIKNFKAESNNEIIQLNLDSNSGKETRVNIADVGFGVSQIFPIILEGLRLEEGSTLILEQPEIHLHPNLQMQLADYFIAMALSGKSVIVETHSDHIINRIVRRIIEDEKYGLNNIIALYFIHPTAEGAAHTLIEVDENKGIVNWPQDFFDQTATEQEKIIMAAIKKRKRK